MAILLSARICGRGRSRIGPVSVFVRGRLTERPKGGAKFVGESPRLLPGGEVATLVDLVVVDEVGICPLRPAPRGLVLLAREHADGDRDGHAFDVEEAAPVFPVEPGRGDP